MPRISCWNIRWSTRDEDYHDDLPDEVEITLDEGYCPDFEPEDSLSREFGCRVFSVDWEENE